MDRSINRIELRGRVGQDARISKVGESYVARFSIATNETIKDHMGNIREETTWHSVSAWKNRDMPDFEKIRKGMCLYVVGKMRTVKYRNQDGQERLFYEVLASKITIE